jgi:hypothetical protein
MPLYRNPNRPSPVGTIYNIQRADRRMVDPHIYNASFPTDYSTAGRGETTSRRAEHMTLKPEHIVEALNKKTFDEIDPDEVLKHYGYKPEEVRCNGVGIGVWRKEEAFQKLGDIGAFMRFVDHKAKARIEFNYDPDFPAALLITHAATKT